MQRAILATLVSEREYQRDQRGRFGAGGSGAQKNGDHGAIKDKGTPAPAAKPSQSGKAQGFHYLLPAHGRAIFRKAGQKAGRQSSIRAAFAALFVEANASGPLAHLERKEERTQAAKMSAEEYQKWVGQSARNATCKVCGQDTPYATGDEKAKPTACAHCGSKLSEAVRASWPAEAVAELSQEGNVVHATLVKREREQPTAVRAEMIDPGADHTDRVPEKSFIDDLDRKLKLKKVMGKKDDDKGAGPKVDGTFKQQSEQDEELPPEGLQYDKEDVNYRYAAQPEKACSQCVHYKEPGSCEIVAGLIRRVDTCDRFKPGEQTRAVLVGFGEARKLKREFKRTIRGKFSVLSHARSALRTGVQIATTVEGGPGSGRTASKFAPAHHDDEDKTTQKFTRREKPAERGARIRAMVVPKDRADVIKKAFGIRASFSGSEGEMGNMNDQSTIKGIG